MPFLDALYWSNCTPAKVLQGRVSNIPSKLYQIYYATCANIIHLLQHFIRLVNSNVRRQYCQYYHTELI